jgi:hypothetical protein
VRQFGEQYRSGQHLTMLGPTQRGKTTLCLQLLKSCTSPDLKCVILAGKPPGRDGTMAAASEYLNLRTVEEWPPCYNWKDKKRNGYVLRPHHTLTDTDKDEENLTRHFQQAMRQNYAAPPHKPVITVVDEAHHVVGDLGLKKEYVAPLRRGAPVNSEWSLIQRGRFIPYEAYDAPEHIILFFDPDRSNQRRYSEIGGVDPDYIVRIVSQLRTHETKSGATISEFLYIRRAGPQLCIVDVD